jgi:hypothetical protein
MMAHTNKQGACVPWFHHYWIMHAPTSNQIIILHPPIPSCCPAYTHPITTSSHSHHTDSDQLTSVVFHIGLDTRVQKQLPESEWRNKPAPGPSNHGTIGKVGGGDQLPII